MGSSSEGNDMASHERRPTRRVDQDLQAIGALTQSVLDASDIEQLLGKVAAEARTLVGAALGVVVTVAGNPGTMKFRAVDGSGGGNVRMGFEMPVASTLTELVLKRRTTFVARSASDMPVPDRNLALAINVGPLVAAPLADIGPARGVLVVAKPEGSLPFRPADIQLISTFAAQAASAIELFDLRSDVADLAARAERDRIARDLTGRVIDVLGDVELSVRALATGTTDARLEAGIDAAVGQLHGAITTVQTYVGELQATTSAVPTPRATRRSAGAQPPQADRPENELSLRGPGSQSTIEAIGRLAVASARDTSTDEVLQSLIDGLVQAIDGGSALINTLIDDDRNGRVRTRTGPLIPGREVGDAFGRGERVAARSVNRGRALVMTSVIETLPSLPPAIGEALGPAAIVPLAVRDRTFGALVVGRPIGAESFSAGEIRLIEAYAAQAAIALEFERVREELRRGSVSAERDRIGRDVQDRVIQLLFDVALTLQELESAVSEPSVRASLEATVDGLDRAIRDLRRFISGLGPRARVEKPPEEKVEALAAENARLQAEIEVQLDEVRASRTRIVAAGDAERKRLERDLHDGAQQRLVSLTLALRLARAKLGDDLDPSAALSLDQASDDARAALSELRQLARGIHPQILTEAGLGPAIETLASRSPFDVSVEIRADRFSAAIEGAAYFTVSEALANIAKYAKATSATVRADVRDGHLTVEIADDGVGGADPTLGSGLCGLADRLAAISGTLEIVSPSGGGTRLVARIPNAARIPVSA
jgi:signal transduction histidine kinase